MCRYTTVWTEIQSTLEYVYARWRPKVECELHLNVRKSVRSSGDTWHSKADCRRSCYTKRLGLWWDFNNQSLLLIRLVKELWNRLMVDEVMHVWKSGAYYLFTGTIDRAEQSHDVRHGTGFEQRMRNIAKHWLQYHISDTQLLCSLQWDNTKSQWSVSFIDSSNYNLCCTVQFIVQEFAF